MIASIITRGPLNMMQMRRITALRMNMTCSVE
jgi:hypothetical protein